MLSVTINDVLAEQPCPANNRDTITAYFAGRERLTALEVLALVDLSDEYKLWLVLRPKLLEPEMLSTIRAEIVALIDPANEFYQQAIDATPNRFLGRVCRGLAPATVADVAARLMTIVRQHVD